VLTWIGRSGFNDRGRSDAVFLRVVRRLMSSGSTRCCFSDATFRLRYRVEVFDWDIASKLCGGALMRVLRPVSSGMRVEGFSRELRKVTIYLVTGGAGFIGSHLATRLVEEGHSVRVFDNLSTGSLANLAHLDERFEFIEGDLRDRDAVTRAVGGVEVVFHEAALASVPRSVERPLDTHDACVTGTINLLDAARRAGVRRVVYAASSSAYGNQKTMPKHEGQVPQVLSPYAAAKLAAELYCEAFASTYGLETVRLRYFNVFGPRQDPNSPYSAVIPRFVAALLNGDQPVIYGDGSQSRDFTFVDNVVEANLLAAQAQGVSGRVYNTACGQSLDLVTLLRLICERLDVTFAPYFAPARVGDVQHSWADISAAERDLGYRARVSVSEGLARTVDWYVEQHRLARQSTEFAAAFLSK
jgi:UDP-glucose 4-epimerase